MKRFLPLTFIVLAISGCSTGGKPYQELTKEGIKFASEDSHTPNYPMKDNYFMSCTDNKDNGFTFTNKRERETTAPKAILWIPIAGGILSNAWQTKETGWQRLETSDRTMGYHYIVSMRIETTNIDVYNDYAGFNKNFGDLIYLYQNELGMHAFRTNTGIVPKLSSFYDCK
ncbi:hypothetical protein ACE3KW_18880 [Enterobacter hormaechei subsp. xiangfangensis]